MVVQSYDLSALELWQSGKEGLEHSADGVAQAGDEVVEDKFGVVGCGTGVALHRRRFGIVG